VADVPPLTDFCPFGSLFGLEAPSRVLWAALARDQLAGSYLFKGPTGIGKTALALAFAQAATCPSPIEDPFGACESCRSCRMVAAQSHPEVALVRPAGEQTQIWQFWDRDGRAPGVLERSLQFAPTIGRRRIYIIERADTLNIGAANSLLKVLEEPPGYAIFLLLAPTTDRVLPTILSRCQVVAFRPTDAHALEDWLVSSYELPRDRAAVLASLSQGLPGLAVRFARNPSAEDDLDRCGQLALRLASAQPLAALKLAEEMRALASSASLKTHTDVAESEGGQTPRSRVDRSAIGNVLDLMAVVYRDVLALSLDPLEARTVHRDLRADLMACAASASPRRWLAVLDALARARRRLEQNVSPQLVTDWLAVAIATRVGEPN